MRRRLFLSFLASCSLPRSETRSPKPAPAKVRRGGWLDGASLDGAPTDGPSEEVATHRSTVAGESTSRDDAAVSLTDSFPGLATLGRISLGQWPTPLERADTLGRAIGAELWIKRDDLAAEPYGGSKVRKLAWWLGEAERQGSRSVVTFGGAGSHHALATAIYARQRGLGATLLLLPEPPSEATRATVLGSIARGAELHLAGTMRAARRKAATFADAFVIPPGGSGPLGNLGYVEAGLELDAQIVAGAPAPDAIFVALGTMGTAVGLAIGLALAGRAIPIVAVRASSVPTSSLEALAKTHAETVAFCRAQDATFPSLTFDPDLLVLEPRYLGGGYAKPTTAARRARQLAARHGVGLDDTYTAKAFAALVAAARTTPGRRHLFWQTHDARFVTPTVALEAVPAPLRPYAR